MSELQEDFEYEELVDALMEADRTADSPTVYTFWHHYADVLTQAGYRKVRDSDYEYAVWHSWPRSEGIRDYSYIVGEWGDEDSRTRLLKRLGSDDFTGEYKLIKRRKAGPHEDV